MNYKLSIPRLTVLKEKFLLKFPDENHKILRTDKALENIGLFLTKARMFMHCLHTKKILVKLYFMIQSFCLKWRAC